MRLVKVSLRPIFLASLCRSFVPPMHRFLVKPSSTASTAPPAPAVAAASTKTPATETVKPSGHAPVAPGGSFMEYLRATPLPSDLIPSWGKDEPVPYSAIVNTFEDISNRSGRLDKERTLASLFRAVLATTPADLEAVVYLTFNQVHPAYMGMELGIGDSLLIKAICEATGRKASSVEEDYAREGDLGVVALLSRASQATLSWISKPKPLTARQVLEAFRGLTLIKGNSSQSKKIDVIKQLLVRCPAASGANASTIPGTGKEAQYLIRALQGKLRIGLAEQTVLVSLSHAFYEAQAGYNASTNTEEVAKAPEAGQQAESIVPDEGSVSGPETGSLLATLAQISALSPIPPEAATLSRSTHNNNKAAAEIAVKRAYCECPNISALCTALLARPLQELHTACKLTVGTPIAPMLAKPTKAIAEVLRRLEGQAFTMEYKYDGERAQVHLLSNGEVKIFSRNSEDNSQKYPDLGGIVRSALQEGVTSLILDAEVVAYDREKAILLPFQVLSTRKRKTDNETDQKVKIILQAFDLLYLNGVSLLRESLRTRRGLMQQALVHREGMMHFAIGADHVENGDTAPIEALLLEACNSQCEGLMVKTLDDNATYEASKRSLNWLKLKKDYIAGMGVADSVDLVPIGGYIGRGKRVNTYGAYLMACYDPDKDEYQSVCKVGTGFTDADLERLTAALRPLAIGSKRKPLNYNVTDALFPDDWFDAATVWEVQAADLSRSSAHRGGIGRLEGSDRGVGLRFPRFMRERDDKKPEQATTAEQIVDMFLSQNSVEGGNGKKEEASDDDEDI